MAYKVFNGKKPQMNNESSMKTSAAMYASKTSMYGKKPMIASDNGDDPRKERAKFLAEQKKFSKEVGSQFSEALANSSDALISEIGKYKSIEDMPTEFNSKGFQKKIEETAKSIVGTSGMQVGDRTYNTQDITKEVGDWLKTMGKAKIQGQQGGAKDKEQRKTLKQAIAKELNKPKMYGKKKK